MESVDEEDKEYTLSNITYGNFNIIIYYNYSNICKF